MMRIPLWGTNYRKPVSLEGMHDFQFVCVSFEELFAGKIKALLERSAAKDLYDVALLSTSNQTFDSASLRKALILFGVTSKRDWREKDFRTIDRIDEKMLQVELAPFVRRNEALNLDQLKSSAKELLRKVMTYDDKERRFMDLFLDNGKYEPELLFGEGELAQKAKDRPSVLWKLQNLRKHLGLG